MEESELNEQEVAKLVAELRFDEAIELLNRAPFDTQTPDLILLIGYLKLLNGDPEGANAAYLDGYERFPTHPPLITKMAVACFEWGETEKAKNLLKDAIKINPEFGDAYFELGLIHFESQEYQDALGLFKTASQYLPEESTPITMMARSHYEMDELSESIVFFLRAIEINPNDIEAHYFSASAYLESKDIMSAMTRLESVIELMPNHEDALEKLWRIYNEMGLYTDCIKSLEALLEINPNNIAYRIRIAGCLSALGKHTQAIKLYSTLESDHPNNLDILCGKGLSLVYNGNKAEGFDLLKQAGRIESRHYLPLYSIGIALMVCQKFNDAIRALSAALKLNSELYNIHLDLGTCYQGLEKFDEAISEYLEACKYLNQPNSYYLLGTAYSANHNQLKAKEAYEQCLKLNPKHKEAIAALESLELK